MAEAVYVIGMNMRSRRAHFAFLKERAVRLERNRDQQARLAVAGERTRFAREMHDIVTHNLSVMVALADGAVFAQELHPDRATAAMRQIPTTGRQARIRCAIRCPEIAQPVPLADQVRAAGLPTRLDISGDPAAVPVPAQLTV